MRCGIVPLAVILLAACGKERAGVEAHAPAEAAHSASGPSNEVRLDPQALRIAGIRTERISPVPVQGQVMANGSITWNENRTSQVGALIAGRVVSVAVSLGETVRPRQVLARLHSHETHDSRAEFRNAQAALQQATVEAENARRIRDRTARLLDLKAASRQQLEQAEVDLKAAESASRRARTDLEKIRHHIEDYLGIEPEGGSGEEADYVPVRSPVSGVVVERKATPGAVVTAGEAMFTVSDLRTVWMHAAVTEADVGQVYPGQAASVSVRAYPDRTFPGKVIRMDETADPTTRTVRAVIELANYRSGLKPGLFAAAAIATNASQRIIAVAEDAVQEVEGVSCVFVQKSLGVFEIRPVETGGVHNRRREIRAGLQPGDEAVVSGAYILKTQLLKKALEAQ